MKFREEHVPEWDKTVGVKLQKPLEELAEGRTIYQSSGHKDSRAT